MNKNATVPPPAARTFRAATMAEALQAVQLALGPEALIVSVRRAPGGAAWQIWRKPGVEVAALPAAPAAAPEWPAVSNVPPKLARAPKPVARPKPAPPEGPGHYAEKAAEIKALLEEMKSQRQPETPAAAPRPAASVKPAAPEVTAPAPAAAPAAPAPLLVLQQQLAEQGVEAGRVQAALSACQASLSPRAVEVASRVREHLQRQLEADVRVWGSGALAAPAAAGAAPRVVCLVGASGSGKTTVAAKLAALHTRTHGLRVAWVCADTFRAGAIGQARVYAEALRLPLRVAYTGAEVAQAIIAERGADLVLVDLPGSNPRREADLVEVGELLAAVPGRMTCLVASATAKDGDLADTFAAFSMFDLKGLIVTKLDETRTLGNVYNLAWRSRLPLMYFATQPGALDGLQPASASRLVGALLTPHES